MDRRRFVAALGVALAAPQRLLAQQASKIWRIGFLPPDAADSALGKQARRDFTAAMRRLGYVEGGNLKTARALGLVVPQSLLLRADRVIE